MHIGKDIIYNIMCRVEIPKEVQVLGTSYNSMWKIIHFDIYANGILDKKVET